MPGHGRLPCRLPVAVCWRPDPRYHIAHWIPHYWPLPLLTGSNFCCVAFWDRATGSWDLNDSAYWSLLLENTWTYNIYIYQCISFSSNIYIFGLHCSLDSATYLSLSMSHTAISNVCCCFLPLLNGFIRLMQSIPPCLVRGNSHSWTTPNRNNFRHGQCGHQRNW